MTTIATLISGFQAQLTAAGLSTYGTNFQAAINGSPGLTNEINSAISNNALGLFTLNTTPGATGANYQPPIGSNPGAMVFTNDFVKQLLIGPIIPAGVDPLGLTAVIQNSTNAFMIGHETQHGLNDIAFNNQNTGVLAQEQANIAAMDAVIGSAAPGSKVDVTTYLGTDTNLRLQDEGSANIAAFNVNVSAAIAANGYNPLTPGQISILDQYSGGARYLFPQGASSNVVQNADGTISPSSSNIAAAASIIALVSPSNAPINSFDNYTLQDASILLTYAGAAAGSNVSVVFNPLAFPNLSTGSGGQQLSQGQALNNILTNMNAASLPITPIQISTTDGTTATITRDTISLSASDGITINMITPDSTIAPYVSPPLTYLVPPGLDDPANTQAPVQETITSTATGQQLTQYQGVNAAAPMIPKNGSFYEYNDTNVNASIASGDQVTVEGGTGNVLTGSGLNVNAITGTTGINLTAVGNNDSLNSSAGPGSGSGVAFGFSGTGNAANLNNGAVYLNSSGSSVTITGSGDSANASSGATGLAVGFSGTGDVANLSNDGIFLNSSGSVVTINGSGDTANAFNGATNLAVGFSGTGETAYLSNDGIFLNSSGSVVTINGSGDTANASNGATNLAVGFSGTGETAYLSNDGIFLNSSGSVVTINGSGDSANASNGATGLVVGFSGTGETANLSGDAIYLNTNGSSVTANGSNDTVYNSSGATGLTVNFSGSYETANLSNDTLNLNNSSTSLTANGFQDTVNAPNGGSVTFNNNGTVIGNAVTASFASNSSDTDSGSNNIIYGQSGAVIGVSGQGSDHLSSSGQSTFNVSSGTKDTYVDYNSASDVVNLANNVGISVNGATGSYINGGSSDTINIGTGTTLITTNLGLSVNDSNSTLSVSGAGVDLAGGNDNVDVTGGTFALLSGQGDSFFGAGNGFSGGGGGVSLMPGTQSNIVGTNFHIGLDGSNCNITFALNSSGPAGSTDVVGITGNVSGEMILGSNIVIDAGSNETISIRGSNDVVHGGSGDKISATGSNDVVYATGSTINFSGTNTGDFVNGNSDTGSDWGGGTPYDNEPDGNYTGYGAYDGYAFSSLPNAKGTDIGVLASYDVSLHDQSDAVAAQTARLQALKASGSSVTPVPFTSQFEGPKWASSTITWSVATSAGSVGMPYSGFLGSQYEAAVEQAFQVWAAASGLKFQEVADSATSDIRVGWSTFSSKSSSVLGYTNLHGLNGQIQAGVDISLENPNDVALVKDSNGQLAYSGTQAELSQLLIHEIGHALGLADDSDPNSVMNAVLTSTNRTLDATDFAGIKALYSSASGVGLIGGAQPQATGGAGASANPVTVPMTSALGSFSAQAEALISAMASFSPTTSSSPFVVPPTLGSTLTSAAAINLAQPGH